MDLTQFKASIKDIETEISQSDKLAGTKLEELKDHLDRLKSRISEQHEEIAELKRAKAELISLFDQLLAIVDCTPRKQMLDELCAIEADAKAFIGVTEVEGQAKADEPDRDLVTSPKTAKPDDDLADFVAGDANWAKSVLERVDLARSR